MFWSSTGGGTASGKKVQNEWPLQRCFPELKPCRASLKQTAHTSVCNQPSHGENLPSFLSFLAWTPRSIMDAPGFRDLSPYAQVFLGVCGLSVLCTALALCASAAASARRMFGRRRARSALPAAAAQPSAPKGCSHTPQHEPVVTPLCSKAGIAKLTVPLLPWQAKAHRQRAASSTAGGAAACV